MAYAQGQTSIAIGQQSMAHDSFAMAFGSESVAWGIDSIALGDAAIATWHQDIAIGKGAEAWGGFGTGNTAFGNGAHVGARRLAVRVQFRCRVRASRAARSTASTMLPGSAIPFPAMSNAVP